MIRASFPRFLRGSTSGVWRRRLGNMPSTMALCSSSSNNTNDLMLGVRWCSYGKKRVVVEDRVAQWFRRLWALSHKEMSASATSSASSPLVEHAQEVMAMAETKGAAAVAASQHELLRDLKANVAHEQGGRLPVVLVDAVWEVFDAILPRSVQKDLANTMQPQHLTNFFSFIRLLGELDVDLPAVELASKTLAEELERYHRAKDELEEAVKGASSSSSALPTDAEMHRRHDLAQAVDKSKAKIIRCCFNTRTAGSPLYFTWIRHSASRENGIRRLMNFRKTVHFFDIECKKRISALRSQLTARALASAEVVNGTNTTTSNNNNNNKTNDEVQRELVSETDFWVGRQRDVAQIDAALSFLFHDFFSKEFLVMEELTWFSTPPAMLEQIMAAESVHPFQHGLADMKERLQPTHHRHLFAFLHPSVVEEPLIAVQVALTRGISSSVDAILHRPTPLADARNRGATAQTFQLHAEACGGEDGPTNESVDTAIFYSINSAQSALRGMDMGNLLIKRVVREIEENINTSRRTRHLTAIDQFSTLSPIPGFTRWLSAEVEKLNQCAAREDGGQCLACVQSIFGAWGAEQLEERCLAPLREAVLSYAARGTVDGGDDDHEGLCIARLQAALASGSMAVANAQCLKFLLRLFLAPDVRRPWWNDHIFTATLELPLLTTVAHYLCEEKKRRRILDPVGNFHVSNGAMIFRLNFLANTTAQGSRESACVMVNYRYVPHNISNNASNYSTTQSVELGETVKLLLHTSSSSSSS